MIRHIWETHYEALVASHEVCMKAYKSQLDRLECCFLESFLTTQAVVQQTVDNGFDNLEQEIEFFKKIKPKFTAHMIFFRLLYHDSLFEPKEGVKERIAFWTKQGQRLQKYKDEHREFYEYWKSGCSERDEEYFKSGGKSAVMDARTVANIIYETKEAVESSHDNTVATFLALEKYEQFVNGKLATIYSQEN